MYGSCAKFVFSIWQMADAIFKDQKMKNWKKVNIGNSLVVYLNKKILFGFCGRFYIMLCVHFYLFQALPTPKMVSLLPVTTNSIAYFFSITVDIVFHGISGCFSYMLYIYAFFGLYVGYEYRKIEKNLNNKK